MIVSAITAYIGPNGSGKTVGAVTDCIDWADKLERDLYSVVPVTWQARSRFRSKSGVTRHSRPIESLEHLRELRDVEILLDEIVSSMSSRETSSLPPKMVLAINTLRHTDVGLYWTAPSWMRADVLLREVTTAVFLYRPMFQTSVDGQRWPRTRWTVRHRYDGTTDQGGRLPRHSVGLGRPLRIASLRGFGCYPPRNPDIEKIQGVGKFCVTCGGLRSRVLEKCSCPSPQETALDLEHSHEGGALHGEGGQ